MKFSLPPVYPITDKKLANRANHFNIIKELVQGGATLIQIRDKFTPARELLIDLRRCIDFAASKNVRLIVNDRCDLALSSGAAGVHLGQHDLPPQAAHALLGPDRIIGLSTHSLLQVERSCLLPIQYIGFGPIYPTSTKDSPSPSVGLSQLRNACQASSIPVVAIGGIGFDQISEVLKAGAASVALVSALMKSGDLSRQMQYLLEKATER